MRYNSHTIQFTVFWVYSKSFHYAPRNSLPISSWGLPGSPVVKNSSASVGKARDTCSIFGSGRSPEVGNSNPLYCSCLENSMDRRRLVGHIPWSHKELDMTEWLKTHTHISSYFPFSPSPRAQQSLIYVLCW